MTNNFITLLNPLSQFEIRDLILFQTPILNNFHFSITNILEYIFISFMIIVVFNIMTNKEMNLLYKNWSLSKECIQDTVFSIVTNQINKHKGQMFYPFILTLFMFILVNNLIGMIPYSFSTTSHFVLTFSLSFTIVLGATFLGLKEHKLVFFSLFVPAGCPLALLPVLVLIEFISYLARNVSLGLRLAANVLSGHMLLNILSGFTFKIMTSGILYFFLGLLPLSFIIAFSGLELAIAFIQAQVFVVLTCGYIKDALDLH
jgi:F-type H+-transporting ATPase subunit a